MGFHDLLVSSCKVVADILNQSQTLLSLAFMDFIELGLWGFMNLVLEPHVLWISIWYLLFYGNCSSKWIIKRFYKVVMSHYCDELIWLHCKVFVLLFFLI